MLLMCAKQMTIIFFLPFLLHATTAETFCDAMYGCTYPLPSEVVQSMDTTTLAVLTPSTGFTTTCSPLDHPACNTVVRPALQRGLSRAFYFNGNASTPPNGSMVIEGLDITITSTGRILTDLQQGVKESYTIDIPKGGRIKVTAPNEWGVLRGIETFVGLVTHHLYAPPSYYHLQARAPAVIVDGPRTAWRGLLIDTSRHYLTVTTIQHAIDAMEMAKMNVLHWHIVDGDGWPLCLESTRQVCEQHAYVDPWGQKAIYSVADIQGLVKYATARGVRIVPEFDLPGHIASPLCATHPELCVSGCAPDPSNERWWLFLENVVAELVGIFPERFFHGGGDEFNPTCWMNDTNVQVWAKSHDLNTANSVLDYFMTRYQRIIIAAGRTPMFWDEYFWTYNAAVATRTNLTVLEGTTASLRGISGDDGPLIVFEYGEDTKEWTETLAAGIPAINTGISEMWYLDRVEKVCGSQPGGRDPAASTADYFWQIWYSYWTHDPFAVVDDTTMQNTSLMLGGEVNMWGEGVDDTNFESFVFPRTSAAAERMWSVHPSPPAVAARIGQHRCALVRAGVRAAPIGPGNPCGAV